MTDSLASQGPPAPIRPIMCGLFHPAETSEQWIPGVAALGMSSRLHGHPIHGYLAHKKLPPPPLGPL